MRPRGKGGNMCARVDEARVARVMAELEGEGSAVQLLVCDPYSIKYLTGFFVDRGERFGALLLRSDKVPVLFNNALFPIGSYQNMEVVSFDDTDDVTRLVGSYVNSELPLGVDGELPARFLLPMQRASLAPSFYLGSFAVDRVRSHKDASERERMRASSRVNDQVMAAIMREVAPGVTERALAARIEELFASHGCSGLSFPSIVSFGAHAADPHHEPDETVLSAGEVVLFDLGGVLDGYCSDMTRVCCVGEPDELTARIARVVAEANEAAEAAVRPGARFCDIDRAAREVIEQAGFGPYFTHRLGHSIGMQDHEPGDVSSANDALLEPGMTFSVEPGIYLPGRTGVRIEDLVLVTDGGCEVLNALPHDLVVL